MKFDIKNRWTGDVQFTAEIDADKDTPLAIKIGLAVKWAIENSANLRNADLGYANLGYADLRNADLGYANLRNANLGYANLGYADLGNADLGYANLRNANLGYANLRNANLRDANLGYANLRNAKGVNPYICTPSLGRLDQPGKQIAYKVTNKNGEGIYNGGLKYEIGKTVSVKDANTNVSQQCAAGINLAEIDWCVREWREGFEILACEFTAKDIAAIPTATDGKFRVHRCKPIRKMDLEALGLVKAEIEKGQREKGQTNG